MRSRVVRVSAAEAAFLAAWNKAPLEGADLVGQYKFHDERDWKFDFAFPSQKLAVEIEGLHPRGLSRHQTLAGYTRDCEKYNAATLAGWRLLRFPSTSVAKAGEWVETVKEALCCQ